MTGSVTITGARGFLGRHFAAQFRARGIAVRGVTRRASVEDRDALVVDYADQDALRRAIDGTAAVVHLAAIVHRPGEPLSAADYRRVNVDQALSVARAAAAAGARMVFISSAGVLGNVSPPSGLTDDSPPLPHDAYTRSKLEAESELCRWAADSGAELAILRPPVVLGPGAPGNFGRLLRAAGRVPLPLGRIDAPRSFVGARNLADAVWFACREPRARGRTMLVAEPLPASIRELAVAIAAVRRRPARIFSVPPALLGLALRIAGKGDDVPRLLMPMVLRPSVLPVELGWQPPHATSAEIQWAAGQGA